jgi:hypothetical protein
MSKRLDEMIMDTGQPYNDGAGITVGCFWALDFIKHFGRVQTGANISVAMHSYLTAIIGSKWYIYQKNHGYEWKIGQHELISACLFHDIQESFVGDTWRPVKVDAVREQEREVHAAIMEFVDAKVELSDETRRQMKNIDNCSQFVELVRYLEISPGHQVFTRIANAMAKDLMDAKMDDFCLNVLNLGKHPVAVRLLNGVL